MGKFLKKPEIPRCTERIRSNKLNHAHERDGGVCLWTCMKFTPYQSQRRLQAWPANNEPSFLEILKHFIFLQFNGN